MKQELTNFAEAIRAHKSHWMFIEEADSSGITARLHAMCGALRTAGFISAAKFFRLAGTRLGALAIDKQAVPLKRLRQLLPDLVPAGVRNSRIIFAETRDKGFDAYGVLVKEALDSGFNVPVAHSEDGPEYYCTMYCRVVLPDGSHFLPAERVEMC